MPAASFIWYAQPDSYAGRKRKKRRCLGRAFCALMHRCVFSVAKAVQEGMAVWLCIAR